MKVSKRKFQLLIPVLFSWITLIIFNIITETLMKGMGTQIKGDLWSSLSVITAAIAIITWIKKGNKFFCPYIIFLCFLITFSMGQSILWGVGIHPENEIVPGMLHNVLITQEDIVNAQKYSCLGIMSFHLGAIIVERKKNYLIANQIGEFSRIRNAMKVVGIVIGCVSVPLTMYNTISYFRIARQYGYRAIYYGGYVNTDPVLQIAEFFFFPSLLCILIGYQYNKLSRIIVYLIFGIYMILGILSGDRGSWIYKLAVLFWLHIQYTPKFNKKSFIKFIIIGVILIYIVGVIRNVRNTGLNNVSVFFILENISLNKSPIITAIAEMGGSMSISLLLIKFGNGIWPYGNTYLTAVLGAISSRLFEAVGGEYVNVDSWFSDEYLNLGSYGAGFSLLGEAYLNGGFVIAQIILIFLGIFISYLLSWNDKDIKEISPLKIFMVSSSLNIFIGYSRGAIFMYFKQWLWGSVVVALAIFCLSRFFRSKEEKV